MNNQDRPVLVADEPKAGCTQDQPADDNPNQDQLVVQEFHSLDLPGHLEVSDEPMEGCNLGLLGHRLVRRVALEPKAASILDRPGLAADVPMEDCSQGLPADVPKAANNQDQLAPGWVG